MQTQTMPTPEEQNLLDLVTHALSELKAKNMEVLDVHELTCITDAMVVCSGTSSRHVKAIARRLIEDIKKHGVRPLGIDGAQNGEWVLIDLGDVVVHIMQPETREFYQLEKLWSQLKSEQEDTQT